MVKTFVACMAALIVYNHVKKHYDAAYKWKCSECGYKVFNSDREKGVDDAADHIRTEHSLA